MDDETQREIRDRAQRPRRNPAAAIQSVEFELARQARELDELVELHGGARCDAIEVALDRVAADCGLADGVRAVSRDLPVDRALPVDPRVLEVPRALFRA